MNCAHWRQDSSQEVIEVIFWGACHQTYKHKLGNLRAQIELTRYNETCEKWEPLGKDPFRNKELIAILTKEGQQEIIPEHHQMSGTDKPN